MGDSDALLNDEYYYLSWDFDYRVLMYMQEGLLQTDALELYLYDFQH